MFACTILSPFKEFCKKDPERIKALFDIALTNIDEDFNHLSTAIEAGVSNDEVTYKKIMIFSGIFIAVE
jgi:alkyl hydroperoxide reductase subunit AhpF